MQSIEQRRKELVKNVRLHEQDKEVISSYVGDLCIYFFSHSKYGFVFDRTNTKFASKTIENVKNIFEVLEAYHWMSYRSV